jgi:DNA repair exonuclease SbcCD ATPase subunit
MFDLGYLTIISWYFVSYILPLTSEIFNNMMNKYLYNHEYFNDNNERLDKLENELELNSISMIRNINELENKLNYLDLTYKRDLNNVNRNINDFKDRVHIIEDQINNIVSNLNDAFVIAK